MSDNMSDAVLAAPFFVLMTLAIAALVDELHVQARRRSADDAARRERTDTTIVALLLGLAAISIAGTGLRSSASPEQTAAASFAALYVVSAGLFTGQRRTTSVRPWRS